MATPRLRCPGCDARYDVRKRKPGQRVRCRACETVMTVPAGGRSPGRSERLRRMAGPRCERHPHERSEGRCAGCQEQVCGGCLAPGPVDHFCGPCAEARGLGGPLPVDVGVWATPWLGLSGLVPALVRVLVWNFGALLAAFVVFAVPIVVSVLGFLRLEGVEGVWGSMGREALAAVALASILGCYATYYFALIPAGCSVFMDQALRGRRLGWGEAFGEAFGRLRRNARSLLTVLVVLSLATVPVGVLILAATYWLEQAGARGLALTALGVGTVGWFVPLISGLGLSVPVIVLEERGPFAALVRAWELARPRLGTVASLVLAFGAVYGVCAGALWVLGQVLQLGPVLTVLAHVVDVLWPALLVALYHGLVAEEAGVLGRHG